MSNAEIGGILYFCAATVRKWLNMVNFEAIFGLTLLPRYLVYKRTLISLCVDKLIDLRL